MKKFSIGFRTLKTAIGTALAIAVAHFFDLQFYTAAGILTILSVQATKRKSLHAVYTRVVASCTGLLLGYIIFEFFGYNPLMLALLFIIFIPTIVSLGATEGFVSSAVILMHVYATANFTWGLLWNEVFIMLIGFGMGLAVNMYMPDIQHELNQYRLNIEKLYREIFQEIAQYLRNGDTLWDGHQIIEATIALNKAKAIAFSDVENHLTRKENSYYVYFDMREKQLGIIERVLPKVTTLPVIVDQAAIIADFIEDLGGNVHSGNTASEFREKLAQVKNEFAKMPLPTDHNMFIAMASLYQFIEEMDEYLAIKQGFMGLKLTTKQ